MEKPDLFRTGIFIWLVLLSALDIWQCNNIKKLSQVQTSGINSSCKHEDDLFEREIQSSIVSNYQVINNALKRDSSDHELKLNAADADMVVEVPQHHDSKKRYPYEKQTSPQKKQTVRENMRLSRLSVKRSKRRLAEDLSIHTESNGTQKINYTKQSYSSHDYNTTCILLNRDEQMSEFVFDKNNTEFFFDFKIRTDNMPQQTSWSLSQKDSTNMVIDSKSERTTNYPHLSALTLHTFQYHCTIISKGKEQKKEMSEPICYDFYLHDSNKDGICCSHGLGYYELNIENSTTPLINDRIHGWESSTRLCIDNNGSLVNNKQLYDENESKHSKKYPSRECINNTCVCDSNPPLFVSNEDSLHGIKSNIMIQMMSLSGSEKLMDINTPQYKAACWILKDDPYFTQQNISNILAERIEVRIIQRYILAVFYFATTGEKWDDHFYFLSNRSECEWNTMDDFYDYNYGFIGGSICNKDENVISIVFGSNNLDGTIIEELYGLTKLEQLSIRQNENLRESIPSSLGRLSELRYLRLFENSLEGSIPSELFKATKMEYFYLGRNNLSSSIPENIGNLKKLTYLGLFENQLTGSIPDSTYSLTSLVTLSLRDNKLSSSISPLISDLKRLNYLWLSRNILTGEIPSSMKHLSRLKVMVLNDNELSGEIPNGLESLSRLAGMTLNNNHLIGAVSDELCEKDLISSDYDYFRITADCRNDVFLPDVSCSCCYFCTDQTPQRNGECADKAISIDIDHKKRDFFDANSDHLEWSLIDQSTGNMILYDGPYLQSILNNTRPSYNACAVNTGCYSLIMKSPPEYNTNYTIFWNNDLIYSGTFLGFEENNGVYKNNFKKMVTFHYDAQVGEFIFNNTTCNNVQLTCGNNDAVFLIEQDTIERRMYSTAVKISGMSQLQNVSSIQSKALCWILQHENNIYNNTNNDILQTRFTQRYVLTMLHLMSVEGLFGPNEYPPLSNECDWEGIECKVNNTNMVTTISLSPSKGQIIDGPLINEIGSLAFVEVLRLSQTELTGSIPLLLSNMWSLVELDLSSNSLSSSIPDTFFNELKHLKYLNLSKNKLTSSIPSNVGSYSEISSIILYENKFIGSVPLDNFQRYSLEQLDVSENVLNEIDFFLLQKHSFLHTINLATNFFVGELHEDMFVSLPKLQYFNASKNELGGVIPSRFSDNSNITHFDVHQNQFKGPIPIGMTRLNNIHHLNLQGNKLTGSLPSQLNQLKSLDTIVLSHNQLKGSIPFDTTSLQNVKRLHLHSNKLSGEAPPFSNMTSYITDCGFPSDSLDPVRCSSCDICCNANGECQRKRNETNSISPKILSLIFIFVVIAFILLFYAMKGYITSSRFLQSYFSSTVKNWNALMLIDDSSVYQFMLTKNKVGWMIAFACVIIQIMTLFLFIKAADITNESSDLIYTMTCPSNSLECDNAKSVSFYGALIFSFILAVWLLRDIASSVKLMLLSFEKRNIDFLFTGGVMFLVTVLSVWTSIYYNIAIATKNTELIVNAVILLFVIEIDERLYQLASSCDPLWVAEIEGNARDSVNIDEKSLLLSSKIREVSESFGMFRKKAGVTSGVESREVEVEVEVEVEAEVEVDL